jgi:hypothetical protein
LKKLFEHGQLSGLGANRSQGYGTYELIEWNVDEKSQKTDPWKGLKKAKAKK